MVSRGFERMMRVKKQQGCDTSLAELAEAGLLIENERLSQTYLGMFTVLTMIFAFVLLVATERSWFREYSSLVFVLGIIAVVLSLKIIAREFSLLRSRVVARLGGELAAAKRLHLRKL